MTEAVYCKACGDMGGHHDGWGREQVSEGQQWRGMQYAFATWAIAARIEKTFFAIEDRCVGRWMTGDRPSHHCASDVIVGL
eukprot:1082157-Rhodomonas_salina.6